LQEIVLTEEAVGVEAAVGHAEEDQVQADPLATIAERVAI